ncbi:hypothetical protein F5X68DRAFT_69103 [Plectosphaerella plurivora]|uniref:DUF6536 domain-containing protein n=1 Tax=Plectosphaerella plurivora TaxID=936078 RepID=A0A9P9AC97_9PEZI|nr:hypothetical protein F5X68DRAFT_69103 [Plectosphaerella plurivora]
MEGTQPAVEEKQEAVQEKQPAVEDTQPATEGTQPAVEGGRFSERYVWDRRGDNEKTPAPPSNPPPSRPGTSRPTTSRSRPTTSRSRPTTSRSLPQSSHRQTVHWPFLNDLVVTEYDEVESETSSIRPLTSSYPRRATWQPGKRNSSASLLDIVPDYIINYLRGETPESLARKREMKQNPTPEEIANELRNQFEGFSDGASAHYDAGINDSQGELIHVLPGHGTELIGMGMRQAIRGWRGGVILNCIIAGLIVLATVISFVVAIATERSGESRIFQGTCASTQMLSFGLHAAISLICMAILVAANYGFQILTSPTRIEVDMAHDAGRWLDIGLPSFRNMRSIARTRAIVAGVLLTSAVSVQVMYNSAFFTTRVVTVIPPGTFSPASIETEAEAATADTNSCSLDSYDGSLGGAILLSFVCLVCLGVLLGFKGFSPLVTLGDAVASFLIRPDHPVREGCPLAKEGGADEPMASNLSWFRAPSIRRWAIWAFSWILPTVLAVVLLVDALSGSVALSSPFDSFASTSTARVLRLGSMTNHAAPAFIAALPQLLVAFLYLSTNSLLTTYSLFHEIAHFTPPSPMSPLRVSSPETIGDQTTSLYLTLPRPYSWLLLALFTPLSLFVSFSFRPVVTVFPFVSEQQLGILVDAPSLLAVTIILVLILGLVLILSLRRAGPAFNASDPEGATPAFSPLLLKGRSCAAAVLAQGHRPMADRGGLLGTTRPGDMSPALLSPGIA